MSEPAGAGLLAGMPRRGRRRRTRVRVPTVLQADATDCGVACLAMVARGLGRPVTVAEARRLLRPGEGGVEAAGLAEAGRRLGLIVRGYSVAGRGAIEKLALPAILHWRGRHYVVLEGWSRWRDAVDVVDPAEGRRTLRWASLLADFTGVALCFEAAGEAARGERFWRRAARRAMREPMLRSLVFRVAGTSLALHTLGLAVPLAAAGWIGRSAAAADPLLPPLIGAGAAVALGWIVESAVRRRVVDRLAGRLDAALASDTLPLLLEVPEEALRLAACGRATGAVLTKVRQAVGRRAGALALELAALVVPGALLLVAPRAAAIALGGGLLQWIVSAIVGRRQAARDAGPTSAIDDPTAAALDLLEAVRAEPPSWPAAAAICATSLLVLCIGAMWPYWESAPLAASVGAAVATAQWLRSVARAGDALAGLAAVPRGLPRLARSAVVVSG